MEVLIGMVFVLIGLALGAAAIMAASPIAMIAYFIAAIVCCGIGGCVIELDQN